jgi:peroxiredoxin
MKKLLFALLLPASLMAQKNYAIKGNIKGLKDSTLVFLQTNQGNTLSQDYAKNGSFALAGKLDGADLYQLSFIGYKEGVELFIDNDNIVVNGDATNLKAAAVTGSQLHSDYISFVKGFTPLSEKLGKLAGTINAEKEGKKRDSLINVFNTTRTKLMVYTDTYLKTRPGSAVSSFVLFQLNKLYGDANALEERYNSLLPSAKNIVYAKELERIISTAKIGAVGSMAVDFTQADTASKPVSLSQFKGKYVLVDFWASWCRPCRMENPNVVAAYQTYKDKNFTVLSVSLDQAKDNWLKAIAADKLTWTHVSDLQYWSNAVAKLYGIQSIPANMLIGPDGKIIGKDLRGEELQQKLKELLK